MIPKFSFPVIFVLLGGLLLLSDSAAASEAMPWLDPVARVAPLPTGVWMGLCLFASFGAARLARRKRRRRG